MAHGLYRGTAFAQNWASMLRQWFREQYPEMTSEFTETLAKLQEPTFKKMIEDYYSGAAGLGQIVPGEGGSTAAQGGLERTIADYMAGITGQASQAAMYPWQAAFGAVPSPTAMSDIINAREIEGMRQASGLGGSLFGGCCFNFLEAEGEIYSTVRRFRDEHYPKDGLVGKGYYLIASWFVPLMRAFPIFKKLIQITMTRPIKFYTQWFYGENNHGFIFWPIAMGWAGIWRRLGRRYQCPVS